MNAKEKEYVEKLKELIGKSNEISTFYGQIIDSNATFLNVHGVKASQEEIKKGKQLRDEFNKLKSDAMSLEKEIEQEEKTVSDINCKSCGTPLSHFCNRCQELWES